MSDNVTLVKIIAASDEPSIYTVIFVGIIILIGLVLLIVKTSENNTNFKFKILIEFLKKKSVRRTLGLGIILFGVMVLFIESSNLREQFVALAAVIATVISVISLNESNKIKEESLERDRKENHRQYLRELVDWAVQTLKHVTIPARLSKDPQEIAKNLVECRNELIVQKAKSIVVFAKAKDITSSIDSNIDLLKNTIPILNSSMVAFIDSLFAFNLEKSKPEEIDYIVSKAGDLTNYLRKLLETISNIKL